MAAKSVYIENLKRRTGITEAQLDCSIEEKYFWELAGHLGNFELYLGKPGFDLKFNETAKAELKACASQKNYHFAMVEALKMWSSECVNSYRKLVEILIELQKGLIAEEVCKIGES